jgi:hypothetical protein
VKNTPARKTMTDFCGRLFQKASVGLMIVSEIAASYHSNRPAIRAA